MFIKMVGALVLLALLAVSPALPLCALNDNHRTD
jgi:hypothetical protein